VSHLSKIKTRFKNLETLRETLEGMRCEVVVGESATVNGYYIGRHDVDMLVRPEGVRGHNGVEDFMGFKWNGDELELIGDDYGMRNGNGSFSMKRFTDEVTRGYAKREIVKQFQLNPELSDFSLAEETTNEDGETVLRFERWA